MREVEDEINTNVESQTVTQAVGLRVSQNQSENNQVISQSVDKGVVSDEQSVSQTETARSPAKLIDRVEKMLVMSNGKLSLRHRLAELNYHQKVSENQKERRWTLSEEFQVVQIFPIIKPVVGVMGEVNLVSNKALGQHRMLGKLLSVFHQF